jgi:alpha-tubulin suppressor-like RCC1 family protein
VPNVVPTDVRFQTLSAGAHHNCGLALDGRVWCWGYNRWGQTGNGTTTTTTLPTPVSSDLSAVAVTSGGFHTCALTADGAVWCWGANDYGQLGIGAGSVSVPVPTRVPAPTPFVAVSAGRTHTCAVAASGTAYCWGSNAHGELGDGVPFRPDLAGPATPTRVLFLADAASISAGVNNTCARSRNGLGWCWGRNDAGQLGIGTVTDMSVPTPVYLLPLNLHVGDLLSFSKIAAGGTSHVCGLADDAVFCWGTGANGQLGGRGPFVTQPQRVRD